MRLSFLTRLTRVSGAPVWEQACLVHGAEQVQREAGAEPVWSQVWLPREDAAQVQVCFRAVPEQRASRAGALGEPEPHEFRAALRALPAQYEQVQLGLARVLQLQA